MSSIVKLSPVPMIFRDGSVRIWCRKLDYVDISQIIRVDPCCGIGPSKGISKPCAYTCTLGNVNLSETPSNFVHAFLACLYDHISPSKMSVHNGKVGADTAKEH